MKISFALFATAWLAGCATLSYQEPTQGPRARVRFVTTSTFPTVLLVYDDANCTQNETEWMRLRNGYLLNSNPKTLGMPLWHYNKNAAKEVYVVANKTIYGMFHSYETQYVYENAPIPGTRTVIFRCGTPFSFTFLDNTDYEVKYHWAPGCPVTISRIDRIGDSWSLTEIAKFDNRLTNVNQGCLDRLKKE